MPRLVDELCAGIQSANAEAFIGAHEFAQQFRTGSSDGGGVEPWASRILAEPPTVEGMSMLKSALLGALDNGPGLVASGAAFALSAFEDPALAPELRAQLHRQFQALSRTYGTLWNLIQALERSGEPVFPAVNASRSYLDFQVAVVSTQQYLRRYGIEEPL